MAAVGGLAVGVPAVSMMLTSLMGTLSGGVSLEILHYHQPGGQQPQRADDQRRT
jgi:hypothetical protein